jgi:Holliday junction resolvase
MTGGRASRQKGNRVERGVVAVFQEHGCAAERVPLSGSAGGSFSSDITVPILNQDKKIEVKARASGFRRIRDWLVGNYAVVTKAGREPALITLRLDDFANLVRLREEEKAMLEAGE